MFGVFNIITNQLATRVVIPKLGTTNSLILARIMYSFIPFLIFCSPNYYFFLLFSSIWGIAIGIQAPSLFTQVAIIEKITDKIYNPIFKSSFSTGSLIGAAFASYLMGNNVDPIISFFFIGIVVCISSISMFYFGLPNKFDITEKQKKFSLPSKKILYLGIINMVFFATIGIIANWSSLWFIKDMSAPIYLAGFVLLFFNIGEITSLILSAILIRYLNEKIVGPIFSIIGSIILFLSILSMNIYLILFGVFIFGFFTSNITPIVFREAVKNTKESIPITISHISSIGFSGLIFGPAIVGLSAEFFGLTFNMYAMTIVYILISVFMINLMKKKI